MKKRKMKTQNVVITAILLILLGLGGYYQDDIKNIIIPNESQTEEETQTVSHSYDIGNIPEYNGTPVITINDNKPSFTEDELKVQSLEQYSDLDSLGRCGTAIALVGKETMPTEERGSIGMIKPTGWHTVKYDIVDGKYLYNRCHLIGYQLTGENANEKNLITCTRYMNATSMLKYENEVADYIEKTGNHVLYRVTPIFEDENLLATGAQMEAKSIEDNGAGISFNIFVYNIQDGITIDYKTGDSHLTQ